MNALNELVGNELEELNRNLTHSNNILSEMKAQFNGERIDYHRTTYNYLDSWIGSMKKQRDNEIQYTIGELSSKIKEKLNEWENRVFRPLRERAMLTSIIQKDLSMYLCLNVGAQFLIPKESVCDITVVIVSILMIVLQRMIV